MHRALTVSRETVRTLTVSRETLPTAPAGPIPWLLDLPRRGDRYGLIRDEPPCLTDCNHWRLPRRPMHPTPCPPPVAPRASGQARAPMPPATARPGVTVPESCAPPNHHRAPATRGGQSSEHEARSVARSHRFIGLSTRVLGCAAGHASVPRQRSPEPPSSRVRRRQASSWREGTSVADSVRGVRGPRRLAPRAGSRPRPR